MTTPSATDIAVFVGCVLALAGVLKLALGIAVDAKKLREKPAASPAQVQVGNTPLLIKQADELATVAFVEDRVARLDRESLARALANEKKIVALENRLDERHTENVARLKTIETKLETNLTAINGAHEALRREVRHDVKGELAAADAKAENRFERQVDRLTDVIRGLGRVEGRVEAPRTGGRSAS